ncbi:MAG: type II toxin-antitoxin system RelE/ParE family toxin [Burkholderiales bacterium]|nr:type II toxin-antitoxin system RelE/ParE family toxin [Burkholderiales bacterium]
MATTMKLIATPRFSRAAKKLQPSEKESLDPAVRVMVADPDAGEMKKGDLAGVRVYKYRAQAQLVLVAYRVAQDEDAIKLLSFGSHENFYRDLKRD